MLERIIEIIVLTASKVKSSSVSVHNVKKVSITEEIQQSIAEALNDVDDWEW